MVELLTPPPNNALLMVKVPGMFGSPNIPGGFALRSVNVGGSSGTPSLTTSVSGVFFSQNASYDLTCLAVSKDVITKVTEVKFDATRASNLYRSSSTNQPESIRVLVLIRF